MSHCAERPKVEFLSKFVIGSKVIENLMAVSLQNRLNSLMPLTFHSFLEYDFTYQPCSCIFACIYTLLKENNRFPLGFIFRKQDVYNSRLVQRKLALLQLAVSFFAMIILFPHLSPSHMCSMCCSTPGNVFWCCDATI